MISSCCYILNRICCTCTFSPMVCVRFTNTAIYSKDNVGCSFIASYSIKTRCNFRISRLNRSYRCSCLATNLIGCSNSICSTRNRAIELSCISCSIVPSIREVAHTSRAFRLDDDFSSTYTSNLTSFYRTRSGITNLNIVNESPFCICCNPNC